MFLLSSFDWIIVAIRVSPVFPTSHTVILSYQISIDLHEKHVFSFTNFDRIKVAIRVSPVFPTSHTVIRSYQISIDLRYNHVFSLSSLEFICFTIVTLKLFHRMGGRKDGGDTEAGKLQF